MRARVVLFAAVACHGDRPAPATRAPGSASAASAAVVAAGPGSAAAPSAPEPVRFVVVDDKSAELFEVTGDKVTPAGSAVLPGGAKTVVWTGADPIALLGWSPEPEDMFVDAEHAGGVGAITPRGFAPVPAIPDATWRIPKPENAEHFQQPLWQLVATPSREVWLGRCDTGGFADGMTLCATWVWARLGSGAPLALLSSTGPDEASPLAWPNVAAPPSVAIAFGSDADEHTHLTCKTGSAALVLPGSDEEDQGGDVARDSFRWISTDPPMFYIDQQFPGFDVITRPTVVEGCAVSPTFAEPSGVAGPDGLFALVSSGAVSIRRNGKELLRLHGAQHVAFAPEGSADSTFFSDLEHQLAGDSSSIAKDAIVLAPGPVAAGAPLVPRSAAGARITHYDSERIGSDASWFAAEVAVAGTTYRAVELYDRNAGKYVAVSFAPIHRLASAPAPALPLPTPPGPLAGFIAAPSAAVFDSYAAILGTDPGEVAFTSSDPDGEKRLLASWRTLHLTVESVHEVHAGTYGYAVAAVALPRPGGAPLRMTALAIGAFDKGVWKLVALHYLPL